MVKVDPNEQHYEYEMNNARTVFDQWGQDNIKLYLIDLGLATSWRDPDTDKPLPEAKPKRRNKIGTARYASGSYTHLTLPTKGHGCRSRWSPYH